MSKFAARKFVKNKSLASSAKLANPLHYANALGGCKEIPGSKTKLHRKRQPRRKSSLPEVWDSVRTDVGLNHGTWETT